MYKYRKWRLCCPEDEGLGGGGSAVPTEQVETDPGSGSDSNGGSEEPFDLGAAVESVASELAEKAKGETPAEAPAAEAKPAAAEPPASAPAASPAGPDHTRAPSGWKPETAAKWAELDPAVQAEIHRRESDFHKGLESYKADAQLGQPFRRALQPYAHIFSQYGVDPVQHVATLLNVNATLAFGTPEQKLAQYQQLAKDYGITIPEEGGTPAYTDPQVTALQQRIDALQSAQDRRDREVAQQRRQSLATEIADFAGKNEHFDAVSDVMSRILRANPEETLKSAYETACWATPEVRAKMLTKQQADAAAEQKAAERKRAEEAAAATELNRKSKPQAGTVTGNKRLGSMDDTMAATLKEIQARG